jgi:hypothetical protein
MNSRADVCVWLSLQNRLTNLELPLSSYGEGRSGNGSLMGKLALNIFRGTVEGVQLPETQQFRHFFDERYCYSKRFVHDYVKFVCRIEEWCLL